MMMALVQWSNSLEVGIKEIDNQHKALIDMLNKIHENMSKGKGKEAAGQIFLELIDYTKYHFTTEEKFFKQYNYPLAQKHIQEHEALRQKAMELQKQYEKNQLVISMELLNFLKSWITNHIVQNEIAFGTFLKEKGLK